jgi:hypothetical protein
MRQSKLVEYALNINDPAFLQVPGGFRVAVGFHAQPEPLARETKGNLARRFDGHDVFAGIEPVERAVMMSDDLLGFQQLIIDRRVPVTDQGHIETEGGRVAASGVNAVFGHTSGHDQMRNPGFSQHRLQRRIVKRAARSLIDDRFSVNWRYALMDLPASRMRLQRIPLPAIVPDIDHRDTRGAGFGYQAVDVRQNLTFVVSLKVIKDPDLNINNQQSSIHQILLV